MLLVTQLAGLTAIALAAVLFAEGGIEGRVLLLAIGAGVINVIGLGSFYRGLAVGKMSIVAPLTATSAIVPIAAGLVSGEQPSQAQALGICLAAVGVIATATPGEEHHDQAVSNVHLSLMLAVVASLGFGLGQVGIAKVADSTDVLWTILGLRIGAVLAIVAGVALFRPPIDSPRGAILQLVAVGLLDTAAPTFFAAATTSGLLSVVAVLAALYPAVTIVLARAILKERVTPVQGIGTAAILLGVALIAGSA